MGCILHQYAPFPKGLDHEFDTVIPCWFCADISNGRSDTI
jgi:hypothetical protein